MMDISRNLGAGLVLGLMVGTIGCSDPPTSAISSTTDPTRGSQGSTSTGATSEEASAATNTPSLSGERGSSTGENLGPAPTILALDMPATVSSAGPVVFTATTENTLAARAVLDGVDLGALVDEGAGVYSGEVAIFGAVDNGVRVLEVVAENGEQVARRSFAFQVDAPPAGTLAWEVAGPVGSRTQRLALTDAGDVVEVGTQEVAGTQVPAIRKRSGSNGAQIWARELDFREGTAEDLAVTPDGDLWVAMNVRVNVNTWRPRIVRLDAEGMSTGVEVPTVNGATVKGVDSDDDGGCVAVGSVVTAAGDTDVIVWSTSESNALPPVVTWDYLPSGGQEPHLFLDLATDVVIGDGVAWIVGGSSGVHDDTNAIRLRGLVLRMDLTTGKVLGPALIAPASDAWPQSVFFGAALHPLGVLVTGNACDEPCTAQRVETMLFTPDGTRLWWRSEKPTGTAQGNAIALSRNDRVYVAATVHDGTELRGQILARDVYEVTLEPFTLPLSTYPSEATGVVVDPFGRIYGTGSCSVGQTHEGRTFRVHP